MKKIVAILLSLMAISCLLTACTPIPPGGEPSPDGGSDGEDARDLKVVCDRLNTLSAMKYKKIHLTVTTVADDIELTASYILTGDIVTYSIQQLNLLPEDGLQTDIPADYKTVISGSAKIENGTVTQIDGESVSLPSYSQLIGAFRFSEKNLRNAVLENEKLTADIISASELFGTVSKATDMKLIAEYSPVALTTLCVQYHSEKAEVSTVYQFFTSAD